MTKLMEGVTFPQPAGEIFIRPASQARSISSSNQPNDEVRFHDQRRNSSASPPPTASSRGRSQRQQPNRYSMADSMSSSTSTPPLSSSVKKRQQLQIVTDLKRGAPADPSFSHIAQRSPEEARVARQKSQYYSDMFSSREPAGSLHERATRESVITAEVKTNVIIRDEYSFLTALSSFLAQRYTRAESSIAITLQHSTCVLLGASFDPAYLMTISAVPDMVTPTLNKRNAALIQRHMQDELAVPTNRGIVRFLPVSDSCLATCGTTLLAEMEAASANGGAPNGATKKGNSHGISLSSPWRTGFSRQQEAQQMQHSTSSVMSKARHGGSGAGGSTAATVAETAASGAAGAVGAMVGVAGNLFGRRKESKRDLKEQEKRSLLKGKAREGSRIPAEPTLREEGEHGEMHDGVGSRGAPRDATSAITATAPKSHDLSPPAREEKSSWFSRAKNSTRQRAAATKEPEQVLIKKASESSNRNKRHDDEALELQASRLAAKQSRSRASLSSAFRRTSVDSGTNTGGGGTPTLRHKSKLVSRQGAGLARDEEMERSVRQHYEAQQSRHIAGERPRDQTASRVQELSSSDEEDTRLVGNDDSHGVGHPTRRERDQDYYYVDEVDHVRDSRRVQRQDSGRQYRRDARAHDNSTKSDRFLDDNDAEYQDEYEDEHGDGHRYEYGYNDRDEDRTEAMTGTEKDRRRAAAAAAAAAARQTAQPISAGSDMKGKKKVREREMAVITDDDIYGFNNDINDGNGHNVGDDPSAESEAETEVAAIAAVEARGGGGGGGGAPGQETVRRRRSLMGMFKQ